MKRLAIVLALALLLIGCYSHINQVKGKWGPAAKVEERGDTIVYYYYFYKGGGRIAVTDSPLASLIMDKTAKAGWYVVEITTDAEGKILGKRKYWKQPEIK